jgi:hypothetical protein
MLDLDGTAERRNYSDGIDSNGSSLPWVRLAPRGSEAAQSRELRSRDCLKRMPVRHARPSFHFDERDFETIPHDEVDLALRTPPIGVDHLKPRGRQMRRGNRFASPTEVVFRCHA